jgi:pSer/pThr/pTyr-binding forkhead associated (FHA) protein
MQMRLEALDGQDAHGRSAVDLSAALGVGRHPSNGLVLAHDGVSRHHALIERDATGWWLRDRGSKNGSTVNDQPVEGRQRLEPGDRLRFGGGTTWRFVVAPGAVDTAPTTASASGSRHGLTLEEQGGDRRVRFSRLLTIGRDHGNGLVLEHERVSAHHAVIERRGPGWFLRDLGSRNGTSVDGRRVTGWRALGAGNRILLGGAVAWEVQLDSLAVAQAARAVQEHTVAEASPPPLRLVLAWDGEDGLVRVEHGGVSWVEPAGQPFLLLWALAESPEQWVPDAVLEEALWGPAAGRRSRTALNTAIYNARKLFARHGLPTSIIRKDPSRRGRTMLCLPPTAVERVG